MQIHFEKRGVRDFVFIDDVFNVPVEYGKSVLSLIAKEFKGIRLSFPNGLRADYLDEKYLDLFKEAGTAQMSLAIETASPRLQKIIGKNLDLEKARRAIKIASERFIVRLFLMIGFPTETYEEALETIHFAEEFEHLTDCSLNVVRVFRGSSLFQMLKPSEEQIKHLIEQEQDVFPAKLIHDQPSKFYGDFFPKEKVPLGSEDIEELRWEWFRSILANEKRIKNADKIFDKYFTQEEKFQYYRHLYDRAIFDEKSYKQLLRGSGSS
jgi:radical SAM superfamily enzyme YgiQ (UPF0313 family)